ncbi:MAG: response regulator transcription factor [Alphaproteobacteria bacterium]|nr:response regulator transcription factor [Alphaproteobacteria bacterium]
MKILIADDHALFRDHLALNLENIAPQTVIVQVSAFSQALKILKDKQDVDMIFVDLDMPDMKWENTIRQLKNIAPNTDIVVVSASEDVRQIMSILRMDIKGYIPKRTEPNIIQEALKKILSGEKYIPQALENTQTDGFFKMTGKTLTNRQSQVLDLMAEGKSNKQIAYEMGVSEATVKLHINALLRSLKVNNRTQAVVTAQKMGLI